MTLITFHDGTHLLINAKHWQLSLSHTHTHYQHVCGTRYCEHHRRHLRYQFNQITLFTCPANGAKETTFSLTPLREGQDKVDRLMRITHTLGSWPSATHLFIEWEMIDEWWDRFNLITLIALIHVCGCTVDGWNFPHVYTDAECRDEMNGELRWGSCRHNGSDEDDGTNFAAIVHLTLSQVDSLKWDLKCVRNFCLFFFLASLSLSHSRHTTVTLCLPSPRSSVSLLFAGGELKISFYRHTGAIWITVPPVHAINESSATCSGARTFLPFTQG